MKNNIKFLLFAGLMAGSTACTDLDVDINSQYTQYPTNDIAIEAKMANCYYSFRGPLGRRYKEAMLLSSDECTGVNFGGDYLDNYNYAHPTLHNFSPDDPCIGWWSDLSSGITNCNRVIVEIGGEDGRDAAVAPARAMRAFYHFILMDCFGDVPLADHIPSADEAIERAPRADVARFIESELLDILDQLSTDNNSTTYGKPNRWMAEALLAKLYINWPVYTCDNVANYDASTATNEKLNDCVKICDDIINSGIFSVGTGYRQKFLPSNGVQIKDFIYAMEYDPENSKTGMDYARYFTFRQGNKLSPYSYYGFTLASSVGGNMVVTPDFVDKFCLAGDERNNVIIGGKVYLMDSNYDFTTEPCLYNGDQIEFTKDITLLDPNDAGLDVGKNITGWQQGYHVIKYPPREVDYTTYSRNQTNDVPIFRYADILLTKAEAILRGATATNGDTPASLINQVRDCSSAPHVTGTPTLNELLDERGRELFCENWRRNDLIRFGKFEDDWGFKNKINPSAKTNKNLRVFPVPTGMLNTNTNWTQNPGY
jgi:hypothetical protein